MVHADTPASAPRRGHWPPAALRAAARATSTARGSLRRMVLWGVGAYAVVFVALVALGINGSSMGLLYSQLFGGRDPALLAGSPRPIRSDEWLVVAPLTIAQVEQGLPRFSDLFPGGFDTSIVWDLPYRDWSVLLRPHMWGFFFLPLDQAFAFKWWLPFFAVAVATYVLLCALWRRGLAAFAVAGGFALSPFFMWWFVSNSFWPPACAIAACAVLVLMLRTQRPWHRWVLAGVAGLLVAVAVVLLYPPYLIPCLYPALGFCVGWFLTQHTAEPWAARLRRVIPLGVAAVGAAVVVGLYLLTRRDTVEAVMSTVYPGQRLTPPGEHAAFPPQAMYAGVFGRGLEAGDLTGFAANASEGSSFIFVGLLLLPSALWLLWSRRRRGLGFDWATVGVLGSLALMFAFIYLPGWEPVAHLLLLDRVVIPRIVIGIGVGSLLLLALVVGRLREEPDLRAPMWSTAASVVLALGAHLWVGSAIAQNAPAVLDAARPWLPLVALLVVAVALFSRGRATVPAVLFAVVSLAVGGTVNPLYRGVLDLRETEVGHAIEQVDAEEGDGTWIALSGFGAVSVLRETGVEAFSGVQGWPSDEMWDLLDPDGSDEQSWNRYAHLNWTADPAAPEIALVQADVVQLRLDSCGAFAQQHVDHVLSETPVDQPCLEQVESVPEGATTFYIYDVVPPA